MGLQSVFPHFAIVAILFEQCLGSNDLDFSVYKTIDTGSPPIFSCNGNEKERIVLRDPCGTLLSPCFPNTHPKRIKHGIKIYDLDSNNGTEVVAYAFTINLYETYIKGIIRDGYLFFFPTKNVKLDEEERIIDIYKSKHNGFLSGSASSDQGVNYADGKKFLKEGETLVLNHTSFIIEFLVVETEFPGYNITYCADFNQCNPDLICSSPVHGTCTRNGFRSYACVCNAGYTGATCLDLDECLAFPCDSNAHCENTHGSFICTCNNGYIGDGFSCTISDRCIAEDGNNCSPNAHCTNTQEGGFTCACKTGFIGDGVVCIGSETKVALKSSTASANTTNSTLPTSTAPSNSTLPTNMSWTRNDSSIIHDWNDTALLETGENDVSSDGNNTGTILGVVLTLLFGILSLVLFLFFRKKKKDPEKPISEIAGKNNYNSAYAYGYGSTTQYTSQIYK